MNKQSFTQLKNLIEHLPKSKILAGESVSNGRYRFYLSGKSQGRINVAISNQDAIIMGDGGIANIVFAKGKYSYSSHNFGFFSNNKKVDIKYIYRAIEQFLPIIDYKGFVGSGMKNIDKTFLFNLYIQILPLSEQKKISSILTSVDEVIESTQKQIDKLQNLKKGTTNKLLTKGVGHKEFKNSPLGRIPKSWEVKSLSQVCLKIQDGTHFSPSKEGIDFKYITSKNIRMGQLNLSNVETISEVEHRKIYKRCDVVKNDLLLTKDGANTGNIAMNFLEEEFSLLSSVALIRPDKKICDGEYLLQFMMSDKAQKEIGEQMTGNAITRLTLTTINDFKVILPSLSEQIKIGISLQSIDRCLKKKKQKLAKTQLLKKALMKDLLTGKVRVKVN